MKDVKKKKEELKAVGPFAGKVFLPEKFEWVVKFLAELQPNIHKYTSSEAQAMYLAKLEAIGLLDNFVDVMDAVRAFTVDIAAIMCADLACEQMARMRKTGTVDGKDVWNVNKLIDGLQRANKIANEICYEAGFSKHGRKDFGDSSSGEFQKMIENIAKTPVNDSEDMTRFFGGNALRKVDVQANQPDVFSDSVEEPLSEAETAELIDD